LIKKYVRSQSLAETIKPVILPAYDIRAGAPYLFQTERAKLDKEENFLLLEVSKTNDFV